MTPISIDFQLTALNFLYMNSLLIDEKAVALFKEEIAQSKNFTNRQRKEAFLGIRFLRNSLGINKPITYKLNGKPFLEGDKNYISISHSHHFVAFAFSEIPIGIDLEKADRDASRIINKFVSDDEKNLYQEVKGNWPLELWCAKEAVYKLYDIPGLSFKDGIQIQSREQNQFTYLLEGCVKGAGLNKTFLVKLAEAHGFLFAVAHFRAEP
jgi:phosphopantetheinyl transferase